MKITILAVLLYPLSLFSQVVKHQHTTWEKVLELYPHIEQKIFRENVTEFLITTKDSVAIDKNGEVQLFRLDSGCLVLEKMDNQNYYNSLYYFVGNVVSTVSYPFTQDILVVRKRNNIYIEIRYLYKNRQYKECYSTHNFLFIKLDSCE
jgi:hypothetical protein